MPGIHSDRAFFACRTAAHGWFSVDEIQEEEKVAEALMIEDRLSGMRSNGLVFKPDVETLVSLELPAYEPCYPSLFDDDKKDLDALYDDMDDYYDVGQYDDDFGSYDYPLDY